MEIADLFPFLQTLEDDLDKLEEAVAPLIYGTLAKAVFKLPVSDKAQLYVLLAYAIETIIFSYLRLNGINAMEHAAFGEIGRIRQYFEKIKNVENAGLKRQSPSLNRAAAARIVKHALVKSPPFSSLIGGGPFTSLNMQFSHV
ncbi:MAG: hypothetical protein Q9185_005137 [Variospora sp. 1 TL-2023]